MGAVTPSAVTKTTPLRSSQFRQSRLTKQKDRGGGGGGGVGNELTVSPAGGDTAGDIVHSEGGHLSDSNLRQQMPLAARSVAPFHLRRSPIVRLTGGGSSGDNTNGTTSPAGTVRNGSGQAPQTLEYAFSYSERTYHLRPLFKLQ